MSNPIEAYINGLEGRTDLDPLTIARELHELSKQEISTREAKINEQSGIIAEKDKTLAEKLAEIQAQKAKNFDLAMQLPGNTEQDESKAGDGNKLPGSGNIQVSDLFNQKVRSRHFRNG